MKLFRCCVYSTIQVRYVDQNGKRNGKFRIYLEPWHADIYEFLDLRKNQGFEDHRARDLFYALWIPDLFMKRVQKMAMDFDVSTQLSWFVRCIW